MSTTEAALTVHLVKPGATIDDCFLSGVTAELHEKFGIEHVTIQMEHEEVLCSLASFPATF